MAGAAGRSWEAFMRLLERTLKQIDIAPRAVATDALGGVAEGFSAEHRPVRASVIPSTGGLVNRALGVEQVQTMCLLMPLDAGICVGDGVCVDAEEPNWRCVGVQKWSAHVAAQVERIC